MSYKEEATPSKLGTCFVVHTVLGTPISVHDLHLWNMYEDTAVNSGLSITFGNSLAGISNFSRTGLFIVGFGETCLKK